jgi:hypothetical protein
MRNYMQKEGGFTKALGNIERMNKEREFRVRFIGEKLLKGAKKYTH